jgi:carbonic anhydrase/acetyltransferase-like protein (isoleucine patch superfamily)
MIHSIGDVAPVLGKDVFIAWNAEVAGAVHAGDNASIWFSAVVRADIAPVEIGEDTNIQDGAVVHVDTDIPCRIGKHVTVGHRAILHSCIIGDNCLIGMGAIVLSGVEIGACSLVGAGSLVTQGKKFPPRSLIMGSPAKLVRELTDAELGDMGGNADRYVALAKATKRGYREITVES